MIIREITSALIFAFFLGAASLVVRTLRLRWWRTGVGRHAAFTATAYLLVGGLASATQFWPDYPGKPWIRLGCWLIIGAIPWGQFALLVREQRRYTRVVKETPTCSRCGRTYAN